MSDAPRPFELPSRRVSRCEPVPHGTLTFYLHCGFDADGVVREIFVNAKRETSHILEMLAETCIDKSHRLQYGARLSDLIVRGEVMQKLVARAVVIEAECADDVRAEYALNAELQKRPRIAAIDLVTA